MFISQRFLLLNENRGVEGGVVMAVASDVTELNEKCVEGT